LAVAQLLMAQSCPLASTLFVRVAGRIVPDHNFRFTPIDLVNIYLTFKCLTCVSFPCCHIHCYIDYTHADIAHCLKVLCEFLFSTWPIYLCFVVCLAFVDFVLVMIIAVFIAAAEKLLSRLIAGKFLCLQHK